VCIGVGCWCHSAAGAMGKEPVTLRRPAAHSDGSPVWGCCGGGGWHAGRGTHSSDVPSSTQTPSARITRSAAAVLIPPPSSRTNHSVCPRQRSGSAHSSSLPAHPPPSVPTPPALPARAGPAEEHPGLPAVRRQLHQVRPLHVPHAAAAGVAHALAHAAPGAHGRRARAHQVSVWSFRERGRCPGGRGMGERALRPPSLCCRCWHCTCCGSHYTWCTWIVDGTHEPTK